MADATCDIGLIGLAVMGQNLVLNMNDHGFKVCVFNRTTSKVDEFLAEEAKGTQVEGCALDRGAVLQAEKPAARDDHGEGGRRRRTRRSTTIVPFLEKGDIMIDGGNSLFTDSNRRTKELAEKGMSLYIGTGVSGGEEGARFGPSIMPGGDPAAWPAREGYFPGHCGQGLRRHSVLRLGWRGRRGPLREDGAQRH